MLRKLFFLLLLSCLSQTALGDSKDLPFKGNFHNEENRVNLVLNLYEADIFAPGYGFLGELNGFMNGGIYGVWFMTDYKIEGNVATLRMTNDIGSDAQTILFELLPDGSYSYKAINGNEVKKAVGRRLVRIPSSMIFKRK